MSEMTILIADADPVLADFLAGELAADIGTAICAESADHARELARYQAPDVLVLGDLEPPRAVTDTLRALRAGDLVNDGLDPKLPVLCLTDRAGELHRVRLLDLGADDVMAKPVGYPEVRARIAAILRRARPGSEGRLLRVASLVVDTLARTVMVSGRRVELSQVEWRLLNHLLSDPTRVFAKRELLRDLWGMPDRACTRTLDSHACRLRRKLGGGYISNVWGVGYRLIDPGAQQRGERAA